LTVAVCVLDYAKQLVIYMGKELVGREVVRLRAAHLIVAVGVLDYEIVGHLD